MLLFKDVLEEIKKYPFPALLLGQGFSTGYDKNIGYTKITNDIIDQFKDEDEKIHRLCKEITFQPNKNLEDILQILEYGSKSYEKLHNIFCEKYTNYPDLEKSWMNVCFKFITNLLKNHPVKNDQKIFNICNKLVSFHTIFTLNFDFILYWSILEYNASIKSKFKDGFGNHYSNQLVNNIYTKLKEEVSSPENNKYHNSLKHFKLLNRNMDFNIHYLHGAAHIYQMNDQIIKLTIDKNQTGSLIDIAKSLINILNSYNINESNDIIKPTIVLAGSNDSKTRAIFSSPYLYKMYSRLDYIKEPIVIYGSSISPNDSHIWGKIFKPIDSNIKRKIYCGIYVPDGDTGKYKTKENELKNKIIQYNPDKIFIEESVIYYLITEEDNLWS